MESRVDVRGDETQEWVGMVGVLAPNHEGIDKNAILSFLERDKEMMEIKEKLYLLVCTTVHPNHRARGLGKRLMESAVRWIEDRCKALGEEGVAVLAVRMTNTNANGL